MSPDRESEDTPHYPLRRFLLCRGSKVKFSKRFNSEAEEDFRLQHCTFSEGISRAKDLKQEKRASYGQLKSAGLLCPERPGFEGSGAAEKLHLERFLVKIRVRNSLLVVFHDHLAPLSRRSDFALPPSATLRQRSLSAKPQKLQIEPKTLSTFATRLIQVPRHAALEIQFVKSVLVESLLS
ncbi:hypothetical protein L596_028111 [Steinernema carpocapsae]|uniref:Uncharacterized protein n=1 Tax=Steinernema carpocapsae TaxID=34508 RepID=A0A4U5LXI4_STECR|nr:hypothetical protein L596_028111 [Steinernema carpocapsae]